MPANIEYRSILNLVGAETSKVIAGSELIVKADEYIKVTWDEIPMPGWEKRTRSVTLIITTATDEQEF
jgi:hypothetical protein